MHALDIVAFPRIYREQDVVHTFSRDVSLPVAGPASIDIDEGGDRHEIVLDMPVIHVGVPQEVEQSYRQNRDRRKSKSIPYPNQLTANLLDMQACSDRFHIAQNLTDYAVLNGVMKSGILHAYPAEQDGILKRLSPVAVGAVVETYKGEIVLGIRGGKMPAAGKILPFPAGHSVYDPGVDYDEASNPVSPFEALKAETIDEMGIGYDQFSSCCMLGAARGRAGKSASWQPVLVFAAESKLSGGELLELQKAAHDSYEVDRFITVPADKGKVREYIVKEYERLVDNGLGMMLLYGRNRFGDAWYADLAKYLEKFGFRMTDASL